MTSEANGPPSEANRPPILAGGRVWVAGYNNGVLHGLDPHTGAVRYSRNLGSFMHFASPSAAGGLLFVANNDRVTALRVASTPPPTPTSTTIFSSANPARTGQAITFTTSVRPVPDGGSVRFSHGATVGDCGAVAVNPDTGQASCRTSFPAAGRSAVSVSYSGDAYFAGSISRPLIETVNRPGADRRRCPESACPGRASGPGSGRR